MAPNTPPWRWIDPRTLQRWLNVSSQTLVNWRARGTGPEWRQSKNLRIWYQVADVAAWLDGPDSPSATDRIRTFLTAHEKAVGEALWSLREPFGAQARHALACVSTVDPDALADLCTTLDSLRAFGPVESRPKAFIATRRMDALIGYSL